MIKLLDYILDLFRDEGQAQAFVANPDQALADAGLSTVSSAQLQSVAATAIPSLAMGARQLRRATAPSPSAEVPTATSSGGTARCWATATRSTTATFRAQRGRP